MKGLNKLFVVDDDSIYHLITSHMIKNTHIVENVEYFFNGYEAIEFLKAKKDQPSELPDIIFLDLFMPIMDGWGFLEEYTKMKEMIKKEITIYIISSSISPSDIQRAKTMNEVSDFIIKPLDKDKFYQIVDNYLNSY